MSRVNWKGLGIYCAARAAEPSTWRGLIGLAVSAGLAVSPEHAVTIIAVGTGLAGALGAATPDQPRPAG